MVGTSQTTRPGHLVDNPGLGLTRCTRATFASRQAQTYAIDRNWPLLSSAAPAQGDHPSADEA
ncbi:MAG: hypothetical protein HXK09_07230 [Actinomyces bouchesdurhonensis]|uniref:Uncharacterized protein n=1 Tax=Actinomyces bouchesdurhonensis TaxID=1852361 RepID=A0A929RRL4_9ACTO|nr:hypothetical protein [Actinomyces bouchesdurhonensis]